MRYLMIVATIGVLLISCACALGEQDPAGKTTAKQHLLSVFPEIPTVIALPDLDDMKLKPFKGRYPEGWPPEVAVPAEALVLADGEIVHDPEKGVSEVYFIYDGDVDKLRQLLEQQGAQAGYTAENPKWTDIPKNYKPNGIDWFARTAPDDETKSFTFMAQTYPENQNSAWCVSIVK